MAGVCDVRKWIAVTLKAFTSDQRYRPPQSDACSGNWCSRLCLPSTRHNSSWCLRSFQDWHLVEQRSRRVERGFTSASYQARVAFDSQPPTLTSWSTLKSGFSLRRDTSLVSWILSCPLRSIESLNGIGILIDSSSPIVGEIALSVFWLKFALQFASVPPLIY